MSMSNYELHQRINQGMSNRLGISLESEGDTEIQEIEIEAEQVVINQDTSVDGEVEEIAEEVAEATEAADNLDEVDEATASLESLISAMEASLSVGGFDSRVANVANISLESIGTRFGLESNTLTISTEDLESDAEAETKSALSKAKEMLSALKSSAGGLINKVYISVAAALQSTTALSIKLLAKSKALRANLNQENSGGNPVKVGKSVKKRLTVNGGDVQPANYVKELQRALDKYNNIVKTYADTPAVAELVNATLTDNAAATGKAKKEIVKLAKTINGDCKKKIDKGANIEAYASDVYLGGMYIVSKRPSVSALKDSIDITVSGEQGETVSNEGALRVAGTVGGATLKMVGGAALIILGIAGYVGIGLASIIFADRMIGSLATKNPKGALISIAKLGLTIPAEMLANKAVIKGGELSGKAVEDIKSLFVSQAEEMCEMSTEFEVETSADVSMEAKEDKMVTSLDVKQIEQVLNLVDNTAATTKNMKANTAARKKLIKEVDKLAKAMSKDPEQDTNKSATKAARTFVKTWIKQTCKFEMDMSAYGVSVMKAALAYAEASNNGAPAAAATTDGEAAE